MDIFTENGHSRDSLINIATEYLRKINKPKTNNQNNTRYTITLPRVPIRDSKLGKMNLENRNLEKMILTH